MEQASSENVTSVENSGEKSESPRCYRHPETVAHVSCQRCGRNICPECQTNSAVGVLCPEDSQAGRAKPVGNKGLLGPLQDRVSSQGGESVRHKGSDVAKTPARKTVFGGIYREGPPLVTYAIMGICILTWLLEQIPGLDLVRRFALIPVLVPAEPWRMMTSAFLHDQHNILHIGLNMYMLYIIGKSLEPMLGRTRFAIAYLLSALGGSVGVVLLASGATWFTATVGASGAIFGLFGIMLMIQRKLGMDIQQIAILIAINLAFGFMVSGVSWQAHLGGLVVGTILGAILAHAPKEKQSLYQGTGALMLLIVLILVTYLKLRAGIPV